MQNLKSLLEIVLFYFNKILLCLPRVPCLASKEARKLVNQMGLDLYNQKYKQNEFELRNEKKTCKRKNVRTFLVLVS